MKGKISFLIKILVSIGIITLLLNRMEPSKVWETTRTANLPLLILAFILYLGAIAAGCLKWQVLLQAQRIAVPYGKLIAYTFVALFFGNLLPTNVGGDVVRAYDLSRYIDRPAEASISVVVDRIVGLLVYIGSAAALSLVVLLFQRDDPTIRQIAMMSATVFAAATVGFLVMLSRRFSRRGRFVFRLLPQLGPLETTGRRIYEALQHYRRSYRALFVAAGIAFCTQVITSMVNFLVAVALGLDISFFYFFVFNPLIAFVLLVPISFTGIGLQEAAYVFFYSSLAGVANPEQTLSLSITFHLLILLSTLPGGVLWLQRRSLKPKMPGPTDYEQPVVQL